MSEIKEILVAIAFSDYTQGILSYAVKLAEALEAKLVVANVINKRDVVAIEGIAAQGYRLDSEQYVKDLKAQNRDALSKLLDNTGFDQARVSSIFKVGHPVDTLLRIIVNENVDMVVMGIKGRTDLEYALSGSVAEKVFRRCPVPVVSYRGIQHAERLIKAIR